MEYHAKEQDIAMRNHFRHIFRSPRLGGNYSAGQIAVLDESHADRSKARRRRGWSHKSTTAVRHTFDSAGRGQKCSCISMFTIEGFLSATCYPITEHGIDADTFMSNFIHTVLPLMKPYPAERSVLILDNASVHDKQRIYLECQLAGVLVFFLPPYSYDFSPIEKGFHMGKALLRKRYNLEDIITMDLASKFEECILDCCSPEAACNLFDNCYLEVSKYDRAWASRR